MNQNLGTEYSQLLTELTNEFESMVMKSEGSNFPEKCQNFLKPLADGNETDFYSNIPFNTELTYRLVKLDTMIFKYQIPEDKNEIAKYLGTKWDSKYIKALSTIRECDMVTDYINLIKETGGIGPVILAERVVTNYSKYDLNNPIVRRILAVEILLPHLTTILSISVL